MHAERAPARPLAVLPLLSRVPPVLAPATYMRLRALLFAAALLPLARLVALGIADRLGANPVEFVTRSLGTWTLVMLCVTLAISPLRWVTGWAWLLRLRRMAGLYCFFYASLHLLSVIGIDLRFDWAAIVKDIAKRPYITVGFAAYLLLTPLAATSTNAMVKRLGGRNWQRLHRLVYVIALLAILHYWWQKAAKNNLGTPMIYAVVIGVLLGARMLRWRRERQGGNMLSPAMRSSTVSRRRMQ